MDKQYVQDALEGYLNSLLPTPPASDEKKNEVPPPLEALAKKDVAKAKAPIEKQSATPADASPGKPKNTSPVIPPAITSEAKLAAEPSVKAPVKPLAQSENIPTKPPAPKVKAQPLAANPSAPLPPTDKPITVPELPNGAYDLHKQRLEKMLEQLSDPPKKVSPPVSAPEVSEPKDDELSAAVKQSLGFEPNIEIGEQQAFEPIKPLSSEWLENGKPNWAQDKFDILLIEVNGLKLAVPLIALGQIQALDELTPLFGQSEWFLGLQKTSAGNVKTVDTGRFVMPERYSENNGYQFVVSINGLSWGLAVDSIDQPILINPEDIRWRKNRDNRPWMAGTVKDHMCVLLDIPKMGEILDQQDQNHSSDTGG